MVLINGRNGHGRALLSTEIDRRQELNPVGRRERGEGPVMAPLPTLPGRGLDAPTPLTANVTICALPDPRARRVLSAAAPRSPAVDCRVYWRPRPTPEWVPKLSRERQRGGRARGEAGGECCPSTLAGC